MSNEKLFLGRDTGGEAIYIEKHEWCCGWYWGFGYLGNRNMHYHFKTYLSGANAQNYNLNQIFTTTKLSQDQWWILLDLFKTAYAYRDCAEAMKNGGHMSGSAKQYRAKVSKPRITAMNKLVEETLDNIWSLLVEWLS